MITSDGTSAPMPLSAPRLGDDPLNDRLLRWERIVLWLLLAGLLLLHARFTVYYGSSMRSNDGKYYYATLHSLVVDRDLDFTNELTVYTPNPEGVPAIVNGTTGHVENRYGAGWALVALIPYSLMHLLMCAAAGFGAHVGTTGYELPYQLSATVPQVIAAWGGLVLMYKLARKWCSPRPCLLALGCILIGTPALYFIVDAAYLAHAAGIFLVTAFTCLCFLLWRGDGTNLGQWALLGLLGGLMVTTRYSNVLFALPLAPAVLGQPGRRQTRRWGRILAGLGLAALCAAPSLAVQMSLWKYVYGSWLTYSYGHGNRAQFDWLHPSLIDGLFSHNNGLFFFAPVCLLGVAGLIAFCLRCRRGGDSFFAACCIVGVLALTYVNTSWHFYNFGSAFGARSYLEASPLFYLGLAFLLHSAGDRRFWRVAVPALAIAASIWCVVLLALYYMGDLPPYGEAPLEDILRSLARRLHVE